MKANFVQAKIRNNVLYCAIVPKYTGPSLCTNKILKECNGKIFRVVSPEDKLNYKEIDDKTIGWAKLPLVFTSDIDINRFQSKNKSITIITQVLVGEFHHISSRILLGLDWFTGCKYWNSDIKNYRPVFVTEAENGYLRSTLHITNLKSPKKEKVVMGYWKEDLSNYSWPKYDTSDDESNDESDMIMTP